MGQVPGRLQGPWRQALGPLAPTVDRCHVRWPGAESEQQLAGHRGLQVEVEEPDLTWLSVSLQGQHQHANSSTLYMRVDSPIRCAGCTHLHLYEVCPTRLSMLLVH